MRKLIDSRRGDTFVEVCFALAVFSFIAVIAINSMNNNLSSVQSTLEAEVSRSELDSQTEAIRYIHEAYIGGRNTGKDEALVGAWETIAGNALTQAEAQKLNSLWPPQSPQTCETYINNSYKSKMMVVNTRNLDSNKTSDIIISGNKIKPAVIIPRVTYQDKNSTSLATDINSTTVNDTEGIWFYAVKGGNSGNNDFYDIYIQSCWYTSANPSSPRTIDTVIRLYDPTYVDNLEYTPTIDYEIHFNANGGRFPDGSTEYILDWAGASQDFQLPLDKTPTPIYPPFTLQYWKVSSSLNAKNAAEQKYSRTSACMNAKGKCVITVYAHYGEGYAVHYNDGVDGNNIKGSVSGMPSPNPYPPSQMGPQNSPNFKPFGSSTDYPSLASTNNYCYKFDGWSRSLGGAKVFEPNDINLSTSDRGKVTELYATWKTAPCGVYKVTLTWGANPRDLDSHTIVSANGRYNVDTYYGNTFNDLSSEGNTVQVRLNSPPGDDTSGYGPEVTTITINNLSDFSLLFRVHLYSGSGSISSSGTTVVLTREDGDGKILSTQTFKCPSSGYSSDWDVFKIVNREVSQAY